MIGAHQPNIIAVVLAAGSSRRFGSDKRLHSLDGTPMLQRVLEKPLSLKLTTLLVLKPEDEQQLSTLTGNFEHHPNLKITFAPNAHLGMGHSLAFAVSQLEPVDGALIMLADMPWVETAVIEKILAKFKPEKIIRPVYHNKKGHPVLFAAEWFDDLKNLQGDQGAKQLLINNPDIVVELDVGTHSICRDVDSRINH